MAYGGLWRSEPYSRVCLRCNGACRMYHKDKRGLTDCRDACRWWARLAMGDAWLITWTTTWVVGWYKKPPISALSVSITPLLLYRSPFSSLQQLQPCFHCQFSLPCCLKRGLEREDQPAQQVPCLGVCVKDVSRLNRSPSLSHSLSLSLSHSWRRRKPSPWSSVFSRKTDRVA